MIFLALLMSVVASVSSTHLVFAGVSQNGSGYAWGGGATTNGSGYGGMGWISFNNLTDGSATDYGVNIPTTDGSLSGYAWSENYGWVSFNGADLATCAPSLSQATRTGGNITGGARILGIKDTVAAGNAGGFDGCISLSGSGYGVTISGNSLSGYAWSSDLGWIDFTNVTNGSSSGSCPLPWGGTIANGASVTAYSSPSVTSPATCSSVSQTSTCNNGILSPVSGSYTNQSCSVTGGSGICSTLPIVSTSGSSWLVPAEVTGIKVWAIGAGGGGPGGCSICFGGTTGGGGGAGGVAYKTYTVSGGQTVNYTIGNAGTAGSNNSNGGNGNQTTVTISGSTITGGGGIGGQLIAPVGTGVGGAGGSTTGGDSGSSNGGKGADFLNQGAGGGGGIGGANAIIATGNGKGGNGAQSLDVSGLFAVLGIVGGFPTTAPGGGGGPGSWPPAGNASAGSATGFGSGGGGAGWTGGNGGSGLYGGGGGGGFDFDTFASGSGGNGGNGAVVIEPSCGIPSTLKICKDSCNSAIPRGLGGSTTTFSLAQYTSEDLVACYNPAPDCSDASGDVTASTTWTETNTPSNAISLSTVLGKKRVTGDTASTENFTATYSGATATMTVAVSCNPTVFCSSQVADYCLGETFTIPDNGCGAPSDCIGTNSCDYNWIEVAP